MTMPDPMSITDELDAISEAVDELVAAKKKLEDAVRSLYLKRRQLGGRRPAMVSDPTDPDHTWLNAFACIRPTDEFAAQVGRDVIAAAMAAHPRRVVRSFNAS